MTTPTAVAHETRFDGVRVRYDSAKSYDELLAALLAEIGERPVPINEIATSAGSWQSYRERVEPYVGPRGFMLFALLDHGAWITKAGIDRGVMRVVLGNPLIAITMLRHDVTAGLFAPVELLLVDEGGGRSSLTYVKPSSLMVIDSNQELLSAAKELDDKLAALAVTVAAANVAALSLPTDTSAAAEVGPDRRNGGDDRVGAAAAEGGDAGETVGQ